MSPIDRIASSVTEMVASEFDQGLRNLVRRPTKWGGILPSLIISVGVTATRADFADPFLVTDPFRVSPGLQIVVLLGLRLLAASGASILLRDSNDLLICWLTPSREGASRVSPLSRREGGLKPLPLPFTSVPSHAEVIILSGATGAARVEGSESSSPSSSAADAGDRGRIYNKIKRAATVAKLIPFPNASLAYDTTLFSFLQERGNRVKTEGTREYKTVGKSARWLVVGGAEGRFRWVVERETQGDLTGGSLHLGHWWSTVTVM